MNEVQQQLLQVFGGPGRVALGFTPAYSMHPLLALGTGTGWVDGRRDASFGYLSSNVREWVSEKHGGRISPDSVASISIEELRQGGPKAVARRLKGLAGGQVCVLGVREQDRADEECRAGQVEVGADTHRQRPRSALLRALAAFPPAVPFRHVIPRRHPRSACGRRRIGQRSPPEKAC